MGSDSTFNPLSTIVLGLNPTTERLRSQALSGNCQASAFVDFIELHRNARFSGRSDASRSAESTVFLPGQSFEVRKALGRNERGAKTAPAML